MTLATNLPGTPSSTRRLRSGMRSYLYVVTAVDRYGESGISNWAWVDKGKLTDFDVRINPDIIIKEMPWAVQLIIPPAPDNFIAEPYSGKVVLGWSQVEGATGYHVKRSNAFNGTYETIGSPVSDTTFTDTAVENGRTYYYKVTAVNNLGHESKDSVIQAAKPELAVLHDIITPITINPNLVLLATPRNFQAETEPAAGG